MSASAIPQRGAVDVTVDAADLVAVLAELDPAELEHGPGQRILAALDAALPAPPIVQSRLPRPGPWARGWRTIGAGTGPADTA